MLKNEQNLNTITWEQNLNKKGKKVQIEKGIRKGEKVQIEMGNKKGDKIPNRKGK